MILAAVGDDFFLLETESRRDQTIPTGTAKASVVQQQPQDHDKVLRLLVHCDSLCMAEGGGSRCIDIRCGTSNRIRCATSDGDRTIRERIDVHKKRIVTRVTNTTSVPMPQLSLSYPKMVSSDFDPYTMS